MTESISIFPFGKGTNKTKIFLLKTNDGMWSPLIVEFKEKQLSVIQRKVYEVFEYAIQTAFIENSNFPNIGKYRCYEIEIPLTQHSRLEGEWFDKDEIMNLDLALPWAEWWRERAFLELQEIQMKK
ncbi:MAG: hypothetical protein ACK4NC_05655 [Candidatus Gracilibacteria bacterium]